MTLLRWLRRILGQEEWVEVPPFGFIPDPSPRTREWFVTRYPNDMPGVEQAPPSLRLKTGRKLLTSTVLRFTFGSKVGW
jgi:hypothetical protein